jgi:hypothetical protein
MGLMRLVVHDRDRLGGLDQVYMCGPDELPWYGRTYLSGDQLIIERSESDSGEVLVPWRITGHGDMLLATATLMERPRPYVLEVELARGAIHQLRSQMAQWESLGLVVPGPLRARVVEAMSDFSRAAISQNDLPEAADWAQRALTTAVDAMKRLAAVYAEQALEIRRTQSRALPTWLGVQLGSQLPPSSVTRRLPATFNMVSVPLAWREIEATEGRRTWDQADAQIDWAQSAGLKITGGPLLELDDRGVPDWTYLWEGDIESLLSFMLDHVRTVVRRYRGRVHLWQVAARMTHGNVLALSEEQRLQVTARAIATVRELDPSVPLVAMFDQPWAEYLASEQLDLAPLHFADALVRAELGLSGVGLEINVGYHPGATAHRSPLAYSRLVDTWSLLELPLLVALTTPSSAADDPLASRSVGVLSSDGSDVSPASQTDWIKRHVPLLLAKNCVQVILWSQLSDAAPHHYPHGGLFDADNRAKPAMAAIRDIRQRYLSAGQ